MRFKTDSQAISSWAESSNGSEIAASKRLERFRVNGNRSNISGQGDAGLAGAGPCEAVADPEIGDVPRGPFQWSRAGPRLRPARRAPISSPASRW